MKKALLPFAIVFSLLVLLLAVACNADHLYKPENDTWAVGDMYFEHFSDALSWLSDSKSLVPESRTIRLLRDVDNAESILVPQSFNGQVRIDFQWHSYTFGTNNSYFFKVDGGSQVEIVNEKAVIPSGSTSTAKALMVNNANVTVDNLFIDDRREEPMAVGIGSSGSLTIGSSTGNTEQVMFGGAFEIGSGSSLIVNGGYLEFDSLNELSNDAVLTINCGIVHYPHDIADTIEQAASAEVQTVTVHEISDWVSTDPACHYKECVLCHMRFEQGSHSFSEWTYDSLLGKSTRVCSVCGHVESLDHKHVIQAVPYKAKTCTADGYLEHWACPVCGQMFSDESGLVPITAADVRIPASHNLVHVDYHDHTCTEDGVVEHWFCNDCGKAFTDQSASVECTSIVIPATHQLVHHEPVAATCTSAGMKEYWSCSVCSKLYSDQLGQNETSLSALAVPAKGHSPVERPAAAAECGKAGNTQYWVCSDCGLLFSDQACTHKIVLSDTVIPALQHNGIYTAAVQPTCTADGNIEYWTCSLCSKVFADAQCTQEITSSMVVPKLGHLLSHVGAVAATCTSEGNIEYWSCTRCGLLFSDEACKNPILISDTVTAKAAHSLSHTQAVEPTCLSAGNVEYWTCSECGKHFADQACTSELASGELVLDKLSHSLIHHEAVQPTCTQGGNIEYWVCSSCGRYFSDSKAQNQIQPSSVALARKGHAPVHYDYVAPTCTEEGQIEHWTCSDCGKSYLEKSCTTEVSPAKLVIAATGHDVQHVSAVAATCTEAGHIEYWQCGTCGQLWSDANLKNKITASDIVIPAAGHDLDHIDAVASTCTQKGNIEYWVCSDCGRYFADSAAKNEITLAETVTDLKAHSTSIYVAAKNATCTEDGNIEYWVCSSCGVYFTDSQCLNPISSSAVVLNRTGHNTEHHQAVAATCTADGSIEYWKCLRCGKLFSDSLCKNEISLADTVTQVPHSLNHVDAVAATCTAAGVVEHWHCTSCGNDYADSNASSLLQTTAIEALGHNLESIAAVATTCSEAGHTAYKHCLRCGLYFNDAGTQTIELASTVVPATGHSPSAWVTTDAENHYKVCSVCGEHIDEAAHSFGAWTYNPETGLQERTCSVCGYKATKAHTHLLQFHAAVAHTCVADGTVAYYECTECHRRFRDEGQTIELASITDPASHSLNHVDAIAATCTSAGTVEHWHCSVCGKDYADSNANSLLQTTVVAALGHKLEAIDSVVATCTEAGHTAYKHCVRCDLYFNVAGTQTIDLASTVVAATGHNLSAWVNTDSENHYKVCSVCGEHLNEAAHTFGEWIYNPESGLQERTCTVCGYKATKAHTHVLQFHAAVAHTCVAEGNVAYYECTECHRRFRDEGQTVELVSITDPAAHSLNHVDAVAATCTSAGTVEHWHCTVCGKDYADSNANSLLQTTVVAALGHVFENIAAVAATCTEAGHTVYKHCQRCGLYFNAAGTQTIDLASTVVAATGHTPSVWVTTDAEKHYKTCTVCGVHLDEAEHSFSGWTYDAQTDKEVNECTVCHRVVQRAHTHEMSFHAAVPHTCAQDGTIAYYECTECGKHFKDANGITELASIVDPASHSLNHVDAVAATCTATGTIEHWHCTICGKDYADSSANSLLQTTVIAALGHDLEHIDAVAATCTEAGHTAYSHCLRCGLYFNATCTQSIDLASTVVAATGHTPSAWVNTDAETHYKICSVCGEHLDEAAHSFGEWTYDAQKGTEVNECTVCHREVERAHTHEMTFHAAVPHTCTSDGTIAYYECTECGKHFKDSNGTVELASIVDSASHSLNHVDAIAATCTSAGTVEHWHCSVCGKDYADSNASKQLQTTVTAALEHAFESIAAVDPTCTEAGNIAYKHCLRCGLYFNAAGTQTIDLASTVVPATGHTSSVWVTTDAEKHYKTCTVCGEHLDEAVHSFGEWIYDAQTDKEVNECSVCHRVLQKAHTHELQFHAAVAHTCVADGTVAYYECTECHRFFKDSSGTVELASVVDAASHSLTHVPAVAATCTTKGKVEHWHCSVCGKDYADANASENLKNTIVVALGHDMEHIDAVAATCTADGNIAYKHCVRCGLCFNEAGTQTISLASTVVPATGHTPSAWVTTDAESHYKTCTVCGEHLDEAAHSFGGWTYDAQTDKEVNECTVCHREVERAHEHELVFHAAVPHTCTVDGNIAYYECTECGRHFKDANGTVELASIVDPAGHSLNHVDAVVATCTATGTVEHWHCTSCGNDYADSNTNTLLQTTVVAALGHDLEHIDAVAATCTEAGHTAYNHCLRCGLYFNEAGTQTIELASTVIVATGHTPSTWVTTDAESHYKVCSVCGEHLEEAAHSFGGWTYDAQTDKEVNECSVCHRVVQREHTHEMTFHAAVSHTCTSDGTVAYYECTECEKRFKNANGAIELVSIVDPAAHSPVHHDAVASTCLATGTVEYWHCSVCGKDYSDQACTQELDSLIVAKLEHQMTHHEAVEATCQAAGSVEYWTCSLCGLDYADEEGSIVLAQTVVSKRSHSLVHHAAVPATCTADGNMEYWECSECHTLFADDAATVVLQISPVLARTGHSLVHHDAVAATCLATGTVEYWHCSVCGHNYSDSEGTNELLNLVVPKLAHTAEHITAVAPTCTSTGVIEHWHCSDCGLYFSDSACTQEIDPATTVIAKKPHAPVMTEAKAATCTFAGNIRYWTCSSCGKLFSDAGCTVEINQVSTVVPALGHSLEHTEGIAATCTATGTAEHWHCSTCGKDFADAQGKNELATTIIATIDHSLVHHAAVAATCTEEGTVEYWSCSSCQGLFADEACTIELTAQMLAVPELGHSLVHTQRLEPTCTQAGHIEYWTCSRCSEVFSDTAGLHQISLQETALAAKGHSATGTPAVAATCTANGNSAYWYCAECGHYFSDSACTHQIAENSWVIQSPGHSLNHVSYVAPTCTQTGTVEHWHCSVCGKNYADSSATSEIATVVIAATGHSPVATAAKAATCTEAGNSIYWTCTVCGKNFSDERCQNEIAQGSWIIPATGHSLEHVAATAATCTQAGNVEHWHCSACGHDYSDSQAKNDITNSVVIAPTGHSTVSTTAVAATCTEAGNSAYWTCTVCGRYYSDAACSHEISQDFWILSALGHSIEHVDALAPTCVEPGNIEHWCCTRCGKTFTAQDGLVEITTPVTISATGHTLSGYGYDENQHWLECSVCHAHVDAENHVWGEEKDCLDGHHRVHECEVCGAYKNETVSGYQVINTSIGTISVPVAESPPCGTVKVIKTGNTVRVKFVPNINSNLNYSVNCRYLRGTWSDYLELDEDGYYVFNVNGTSDYKIVVQAYNGGGTSVYETTIR